jgi:hypothetical protein
MSFETFFVEMCYTEAVIDSSLLNICWGFIVLDIRDSQEKKYVEKMNHVFEQLDIK